MRVPAGPLLRRFAVPLAIAAFIVAFYFSSEHLPFRAAGYPRFLMMLLGATLLAIVLREVVGMLRQPAAGSEAEDEGGEEALELLPMLFSAVLLVGFVVLMSVAGVRVAVVVFTPLMLVALGYVNILWIVGVTVGALVMVELVFIRLFQLPLPGVW